MHTRQSLRRRNKHAAFLLLAFKIGLGEVGTPPIRRIVSHLVHYCSPLAQRGRRILRDSHTNRFAALAKTSAHVQDGGRAAFLNLTAFASV